MSSKNVFANNNCKNLTFAIFLDCQNKNQKSKVDLITTVYQNEEKKLGLGASNSLTLSQRKIQLLNAHQQLIKNEFELYKAEVQIKTHSNPIKL